MSQNRRSSLPAKTGALNIPVLQQTILTTLMSDQYGIHDVEFQLLHLHDDKRATFRLNLSQAVTWIVRVSGHPGAHDWFSRSTTTVAFLNRSNYLVPEIIFTRSGGLVGHYENWFACVTKYIEGEIISFSLEDLSSLGAAIGQLHKNTKDYENSIEEKPSLSWWQPTQIASREFRDLIGIGQQVPNNLQSLYNELLNSFHFMDYSDNLSRSIIHGDCRPHNAVRIPTREIVMIDWDWGGVGLQIIDVANLLINCHIEQIQSSTFNPIPQRVNAIIDGYCQKSLLSEVDISVLSEAIKFCIAAPNAYHFIRAIKQNKEHDIWLCKIRAQYEASDYLAHLALERLKQLLS